MNRLPAWLLLFACPAALLSMTVNLLRPYSAEPSAPRSAALAFSAPGQPDFLFTGEQAPVIAVQPLRRALDLRWTLTPNLAANVLVSGRSAVGLDNSFSVAPAMEGLPPGFYDLQVELELAPGETVRGFTTFGWRAGGMPVHPQKPADFDAFWDRALATLDAVEPAVECVKAFTLTGPEIDDYNLKHASLPGNYDPAGVRHDRGDVYRVSFRSAGGARVEGWFSRPAGDGPFPALLILPGAGNNPRPAPVEHARHGYATLDIQVHGEPVDASSYSTVPDDSRVERPEQKVHYPIYLHAVQASRVLATLPGVDPARLAVAGGSQGGRLSIVVAALNPRIRAAIPAITHYAYIPWLRWAKSAHKASPAVFSAADAQTTATEVFSGYFDVLNFAPAIRCPVLMNAGLIDRVSPVTGIYAVYRAIPAPKQFVPLPNLAHDWSPAFDRQAWRWLADTL